MQVSNLLGYTCWNLGLLDRASLRLKQQCAIFPVHNALPKVNAVHSIPGQDVVITSSSISATGPHVLTVWDLPTQEERSSEKQFLPEMKSREETPTRQVSRHST